MFPLPPFTINTPRLSKTLHGWVKNQFAISFLSFTDYSILKARRDTDAIFKQQKPPLHVHGMAAFKPDAVLKTFAAL